MIVRDITKEDMPTVKSWWEGHEWGADLTSAEYAGVLPDIGFIIEGMCASWLYVSNSNMSFLSWVVSNPAVDLTEAGKALDEMINHALKVSAEIGCPNVVFPTAHEGLKRRVKRLGFLTIEQNLDMLMKVGS